ncbi:MAG: hypothetical protein ACP5NF_11180 [Thermoanaerobaculum sp.]
MKAAKVCLTLILSIFALVSSPLSTTRASAAGASEAGNATMTVEA